MKKKSAFWASKSSFFQYRNRWEANENYKYLSPLGVVLMFDIGSIHMTSHCYGTKDDATSSRTFFIYGISAKIFILICGIIMEITVLYFKLGFCETWFYCRKYPFSWLRYASLDITSTIWDSKIYDLRSSSLKFNTVFSFLQSLQK